MASAQAHDDPAAAHPLVRIDTGLVRGRWRPTTGDHGRPRSAAFLGIPFAEPPIGERRFAAPVPKAPWDGVLDAAEYGATAQRATDGIVLIPEPSIPGDSTLNVNVFTPDPTPADGGGLPVMVWIHGGGFFAGSPASPWYDGRNFNRDGIVTVTISYRLGFDGFGWIDGAPSNRGVRDWLLALEWVQRNIAAFGGDPSRVTIAGQSAGGGAVLTLLGMEAAQHLFHGAYAMSGFIAEGTSADAEQFARAMAERATVAPTVSGWRSLSEQQILELQKKATSINLGMIRNALSGRMAVSPVIDGDLILRPSTESFRLGVGAGKSLVFGTADDEFALLTTGRVATNVLRLVPTRLLLRLLGVPKGARLRYLDANRDVAAKGKGRLAGRLISDKMFRAAVPTIVAARGAAPTWTFRFSWPSGKFGFAGHCIDVPFFFDVLDGPSLEPLTGADPPQALADRVHSAAAAFIVDGDPGWPRDAAPSHLSRVYDLPVREEPDAYASVRPLLP
ncbi:carboxylesterase/lipase family protein [Gordonia phosphorivorans]|uniref:Carboxylic ester hydrolase n=1 Tax=Gordonia phosphorivorans TaxID=1056982 RepID=A0ABV6H9P2_9ACTN